MHTLDTVNLARWHRTILILFTTAGLTGASMMVRLPEVRSILGVTTSQLGLVLLSFAVGAMSGLIAVGKFIAHRGTRRGIVIGLVLWFVGTLAMVVALGLSSVLLFVIGGLLSGFGAGWVDVGMNVDGTEIEKRLGRSAMPKMHAAFSIGSLTGAALGTLAISYYVSIVLQMAVLAVICFALPIFSVKNLPTGHGIHAEEPGEKKSGPVFGKLVILLGVGILGMTIAEGAGNDWLAIGMVDDYLATPTTAGIAYAIMVGSMTLVRFFGGGLTDRYGKAFTLRITGVLGILGLLLLIAKFSIYTAWFGAGLWGAGVALAFPLFLSAAGELPNPAKKVAAVSSFGYAAFLVGPPLLGFVGQAIGVVNMYWVVLTFIAISVIVAGAAGNKRSS
jgi:MFS family permease